MANFSDVQTAYWQFPEQVQSLILGTVTGAGDPHTSYAPFVMDGDRSFYIFVSGLAAHTHNLRATAKASILLIEDEAQTQQIFARQRLMYDCRVALIERHTPEWAAWVDKFSGRFGSLITMLRQLPDFEIFRLIPYSGRFVVGFGAAYEVDPANINRLLPLEK